MSLDTSLTTTSTDDAYTSPLIFHKGKKGAFYQWCSWSDGPNVLTEYGQIDGLKQISTKKAEPKNVGRANATTAEQQAAIEAKALYTFKIERKYFASVEECKSVQYDPMLAPADGFNDSIHPKTGKPVKGTKRYVSYPCDVQPKLDGCRCLAYWKDGQVVLMSRGGIEWDLDHIREQVAKFLPVDAMLDGELYLHGRTFQQVTKLIKSKNLAERATVQLHVYDIPLFDGEEGEKPWSLRKLDLYSLVTESPEWPNILRVQTETVNSEDELVQWQSVFLGQGYEGLMIRLLLGLYEWGYRSKWLLKLKTFDHTEFQIVGFEDGRGKNEGAIKWIVSVNGEEVRITATGSDAERKALFENGPVHVGKLLRVKHFGLTDKGLPRIASDAGVRDPMDMSVAKEAA